ncbi:MAG TPA: UDPGP type 1 family protein, partial [Urbifossiella sp.]|nr:UDPGP type 1 family protein [Urbifossiella sp.]
AIHLFSVPFLRRVTARGGLAYHLARKAVPTAGGEADALKFELFVFDALPMAERWLTVETPRAEEFAPLKNAVGPDSPATVRAALVALHAGWLEAAGVPTHGHPVEVSPLLALDAAELRSKIPPGLAVTGATHLR